MEDLHGDEIIDTTPLAAAAKYFKDNVKGAPQKKIAAFVGISQPYISQLVNGDREGNLTQWRRFAEFFGVEYANFYRLGEAVLDGFMLFPNKTPLPRVRELTNIFLKKYNDPDPGIDLGKARVFRRGLKNWLSKNWHKPRGLFAKKVGISIEELKSLLDGSSIPDQDIVDDIVEVCGVSFSKIVTTREDSHTKNHEYVFEGSATKELTSKAMEMFMESQGYSPAFIESFFEIEESKKKDKETPPPSTAEITLAAGSDNIEDFEEQKNARHHNIIDRFKDHELATEINEDLVEIESIDPYELEEIRDLVKLKLNKLKRKKDQEVAEKKAVNGQG